MVLSFRWHRPVTTQEVVHDLSVRLAKLFRAHVTGLWQPFLELHHGYGSSHIALDSLVRELEQQSSLSTDAPSLTFLGDLNFAPENRGQVRREVF
jgi:hypothetical protein